MAEDNEFDFHGVIDQLEDSRGITEEVYELENLKWEYSPHDYNRVMDAVYSDDYKGAREILDELEQQKGENTE